MDVKIKQKTYKMKKIVDIQRELKNFEQLTASELTQVQGGKCHDDKRRQRPGGGTTTTSPNR